MKSLTRRRRSSRSDTIPNSCLGHIIRIYYEIPPVGKRTGLVLFRLPAHFGFLALSSPLIPPQSTTQHIQHLYDVQRQPVTPSYDLPLTSIARRRAMLTSSPFLPSLGHAWLQAHPLRSQPNGQSRPSSRIPIFWYPPRRNNTPAVRPVPVTKFRHFAMRQKTRLYTRHEAQRNQGIAVPRFLVDTSKTIGSGRGPGGVSCSECAAAGPPPPGTARMARSREQTAGPRHAQSRRLSVSVVVGVAR
ncbi:uncharacterized protein CCOS01_08756 [Colletotrichum costaricense]|uniref:Uncharacterized protein n=1 Tax=Colletotrichum costaricense TaxID=1209916 RepID=A0AAI9YX78_9PEZI|nr:uncharacterized protein CCOS01_08756 [Colletotrichum costaricense]KAK1526338.1 hypothetical protein CCOS01_08756 [Colletotrichum costaricense]